MSTHSELGPNLFIKAHDPVLRSQSHSHENDINYHGVITNVVEAGKTALRGLVHLVRGNQNQDLQIIGNPDAMWEED